jgi:hypothetical protein
MQTEFRLELFTKKLVKFIMTKGYVTGAYMGHDIVAIQKHIMSII